MPAPPTKRLYLSCLVVLFCCLSATPPLHRGGVKKKVLLVCTSNGTVNNAHNGTFLVELAAPVYLLNRAGYALDIVSPKGGALPIYHKGDTSQFLRQAVQTAVYKEKTKNSLLPEEIKIEDYAAVIIPGGYGQFWDLQQHPMLLQKIAAIYERGGMLGAIGHGNATLACLVLKDGTPLVKNKTLTCFPSWFEREYMAEANYGKALPFDMETRLKEYGAILLPVVKGQSGNEKQLDTANRLATAAFANDADFVASAVIHWLEKSN